MASQDSSQSSSKHTDKSKKVTYGELYGKATIDPPPPKKEDRGEEQTNPPSPDDSNS